MILERQFEALAGQWPGASIDRNEDGSHVVTVPGVRLPVGWNRDTATIRFVIPVGYPLASPDCFWTEPGLALDHGGPPQNTGHNAGPGVPPGWLWFSWHPGYWNANDSSLSTFVNLVRRRFADAR
jgi:hypothetical protein